MKKKNWVFVIFLLSVSWSPVFASEIVVDPGGSGDAQSGAVCRLALIGA